MFRKSRHHNSTNKSTNDGINSNRSVHAAFSAAAVSALALATIATGFAAMPASADIGPVHAPLTYTTIPSCGLAIHLNSYPSGTLNLSYPTDGSGGLASVRVYGNGFDQTQYESPYKITPKVTHSFNFGGLVGLASYSYSYVVRIGGCMQTGQFRQAGIS